jgi:hypothetical protein
MDATEANMWAHATTPHTCSGNIGNFWPTCDKGGCGANTQNDARIQLGPGSNYTINTLQQFTV